MENTARHGILGWSACPAVESIPANLAAHGSSATPGSPVATVIENLKDPKLDEVIELFDVHRASTRSG